MSRWRWLGPHLAPERPPRVRLQVPVQCQELHHEVELAVVVGKGGRDIATKDAMAHVSGYALALDMTSRDLQTEAKKGGLPWTLAKCYDTFCPISSFIPASQVGRPWLYIFY